MGGLFELCFRSSGARVAPDSSPLPSGLGLQLDHPGNGLGVKQPLAERIQVADSGPMGPGLLCSADATSGPCYGNGHYTGSRSRQRRLSMGAGEALNTTLEMARQRRASSTCEHTSKSKPSKPSGFSWAWLKGKSSKRLFGSGQDADQGAIRAIQRGRDSAISTAEQLQRRGFHVHYAKDIHKSVSTSTTKPIAVLGLEPSSEGNEGGSVAMRSSPDGSPDVQTRRNHNKLFPLYVNGVAKSYFKVSASRDYAQVLRRLLRRDPLLTFALQKAIKNLSKGNCKPVSHVTSDPTGQSASLYGLRITPCVWSDTNGHKLPALLLEHNVPYESQDVMPRLLRDYAVLSHVPSILTLIDFNGHVLYQNAASIDYCGDLTSHNVETGDGMMGVLFQYEPQLLQEMLQEVNEGNYWQQVVRVPMSLKRHMVFEAETTWSYGSRGGGGSGGKKLTAAVSKRFIQDALEPEFQLESFTTQNARNQRAKTTRGLMSLFQTQTSLARQESLTTAATPPMGRIGSGPHRQDTRDSGVAIAGPAALPVGRLGSVTGPAPRLGSNTLPAGTSAHVAFNLPNQLDDLAAGGGSITAQVGSFTACAAKAGGAPPQHSHLTNTGQNRRFMTLMQSAERQQQPSFTASVQSFNTEGEKPELRGPPTQEDCWHDISAIPLLDPVLDKQVILLLQTNVTARVELENRLADLTDAQLGMLEQLFPRHVIEYMLSHKHGYNSRNLTHLANHHDDVIVLFTDVVGFTSMSKEVEPSEVMHFLNELYTIFDDLVDLHDLYKLDTVGDCYIVVAGLTMQDDDGFTCTVQGDNDQRLHHAQVMMDFAKAILRESKQVLMPHNNCPVQIRIGIHLGSLASGLVGPKMPKFTLFGDTMNTASRMESTCKPGCVQVSEEFAKLLPYEDWQDTGGVEVKGKGHMQTFLWIPKPEDLIPRGVGGRTQRCSADGTSSDDDSTDGLMAPAPSTASSTLAAAAPDDSPKDRTDMDGCTRPSAMPLVRARSARVSAARPKSSRPKSSRYSRASDGRVRESIMDGGGSASSGSAIAGVISRPSTASSSGGLGCMASIGRNSLIRSSTLNRSMSRRNVSFRFHGDVTAEMDSGKAEAEAANPFMAILSHIRGSGTGEPEEGGNGGGGAGASGHAHRDITAGLRISSDGEDDDEERKPERSALPLGTKRLSNGYRGGGVPRRSASGGPVGVPNRLSSCGGLRISASGGEVGSGGSGGGAARVGANCGGPGHRLSVEGSAVQMVDALEAIDELKACMMAAKAEVSTKPNRGVRLTFAADMQLVNASEDGRPPQLTSPQAQVAPQVADASLTTTATPPTMTAAAAAAVQGS